MSLFEFAQIAIIALSFFVLLLLWALYRQTKTGRRLAKKYQATQLLHKHARKQHESLAREINELRLGSMVMGKKMQEIALRLEEIEQQQDANFAVEDRLYSRANKMAELGAGLDELMQECDLPKAEAELLLNIKRNSTTH